MKDTLVLSYIARTEGAVWTQQSASRIASASKASVVLTVRAVRGAHCPARMEELASETRLTHSSTAAAAPLISLDDTVSNQDPARALTWTASGGWGITCVIKSVTTMNVSGTEETAR